MEDIKEIQDKFNKVIEYSQGFKPNTDELFARWQEAKSYFIEKFGGLIWQFPEKVTFPMDPRDREVKLNGFIENYVLYRYSNYDLARFLEQQKEGFFENVVVNEYETTSGEIIPKGMKVIKAFKFFEEDETKLDDLQQKASAVIQENKIEGYFCISIHPLDFLSASENCHNWRSCHALDGEYRAGNLSYLLDEDTVMCYLKSEGDVKLPHFPNDVLWNNKKWRMWLHLADNHNAMMAGRQYPFTIGGILPFIHQSFLTKLSFSPYRWSNWHHDILDYYSYKDGTEETVSVGRTIIMNGFLPLNSVVKDGKNSLQFNDLLHSSYYTPWYCWRTATFEPIEFTIGAEVPCLQCGKRHLDVADSMTCDYCSPREQCYECGATVYEGEGYWVEGHLLCEDCFNEYAVECADCGEYVYRSNAYYDEEDECWYCSECHRNRG